MDTTLVPSMVKIENRRKENNYTDINPLEQINNLKRENQKEPIEYININPLFVNLDVRHSVPTLHIKGSLKSTPRNHSLAQSADNFKFL